MKPDPQVIQRFHRALVEEIHRDAPEQLDRPFTVAEIYQSLVPYRTHRDRIGVEMNGDYEDALLRLLAGEGEFLLLESDSARDRIRKELNGANPNTGLYREFAAVEVRLNPRKLPPVAERAGSSPEGAPAELPAAPGLPRDVGSSASGSGAPASGGPAGSAGRLSGAGKKESAPDPSSPVARPRASEGRTPPRECPDCGKGLPRRDGLRFCPHCGANPFHVECSACGEDLDREWSYCIACGTPAES